MPIYEYACGSCEHQFETIQRASEEPLRDCPECGEAALKKLLSAPVFRLKGSGWYETDFKTGDKRNVAGGGDGPPEGAGKEGKADAGAESSGGGKGSEKGKNGDGAKAGASSAESGSKSGGKSETAKPTTAPAKD